MSALQLHSPQAALTSVLSSLDIWSLVCAQMADGNDMVQALASYPTVQAAARQIANDMIRVPAPRAALPEPDHGDTTEWRTFDGCPKEPVQLMMCVRQPPVLPGVDDPEPFITLEMVAIKDRMAAEDQVTHFESVKLCRFDRRIEWQENTTAVAVAVAEFCLSEGLVKLLR